MRYLFVARYNEDDSWLSRVPDGWVKMVLQKGCGDLPNIGREANSYLHAIVTYYHWFKDSAEAVFCQGNPFDHDPKFIQHLSDPSIRHYGIVWECPPEGELEMTMYGAGLLDEYCKVFGLPVQTKYRFSTGAQYRVTREQILARPLAFYQALLALTKIDPIAPYRLERLFALIWGIQL